MRSLLFFESMITPKIITFIYRLLLFVALVGGIGSMFSFGRMSFTGFATGWPSSSEAHSVRASGASC